MMATRLLQECPLTVMFTLGRLPPPSASTTSGEPPTPSRARLAQPGLDTSSFAHRLLHEPGDPLLVGGGQLLQREVGRPHVAIVEICLVAETERRVPRLELVRALVEADDLVVFRVRGHPVPGSRREVRRGG